MAITLPNGFKITVAEPVDSRIVLSKSEMLAIKKPAMPDVYFAICKDDGQLYLYNKANEVDSETGRFRLLEAGSKVNPYDYISKKADYLYEVQFSDLDYDFANEWFKNGNHDANLGLCSSARNGNWYIRNYDWFYDNQVDFIVKTPRRNDRFSTIGVGGNDKDLTKAFVESGKYSDAYKMIPFKLLDGINEYGVFANTNVVPTQGGTTSGTIPTETQEVEICNLILPRFILDHFKTAAEAIDYLKKHASIYRYEPLALMGDDIHVMVGDANETYVIEFIDNELVAKKFDKPIMTNFFVNNIELNEDGSVYTPEEHELVPDHDPMIVNKITSHGSGLERFNLINSKFDTLTSKEAARELAIKLFYTNTYVDLSKNWYTECVGNYPDLELDLKVNSPISEFEQIRTVMKEMFAKRTRDVADTWQTVHSCVYDLENKKIFVISQEDLSKEFEVSFDYFTAEQVKNLFIAKNDLPAAIVEAMENKPEEMTEAISVTLPGAIAKIINNDSALSIDEDGKLSVQVNEDHLKIEDNKIDIALELIQAI